MKSWSIKMWFVVLFSTFSLIILIATLIPLPVKGEMVKLNNSIPALDKYIARITYPGLIRLGEQKIVFLYLEPQTKINQENLTLDNILIEVHLDMPGVSISPQGSISQPLVQGKELTYSWDITAKKSGKINGTLWVSSYQSEKITGQMEKVPFLAYPINLTIFSILGMSISLIQLVSGIGLSAGLVLLIWKKDLNNPSK